MCSKTRPVINVFKCILLQYNTNVVLSAQYQLCQYNKHLLSTSITNALVAYIFFADHENKPGE